MPNADEIKGRAKGAAGELLDDDELKNKGKVDKVVGAVKEKVDEIGDKVSKAIDRDD